MNMIVSVATLQYSRPNVVDCSTLCLMCSHVCAPAYLTCTCIVHSQGKVQQSRLHNCRLNRVLQAHQCTMMMASHHSFRPCGGTAGHSSCAAALLLRLAATALALQAANAQNPLPRDGWTATADSFEPGPVSNGPNDPGAALDDTPATFWHTEWVDAAPDYPHQITITFDGQTNSVNGLRYVPRGDGNRNGYALRLRIAAPSVACSPSELRTPPPWQVLNFVDQRVSSMES